MFVNHGHWGNNLTGFEPINFRPYVLLGCRFIICVCVCLCVCVCVRTLEMYLLLIPPTVNCPISHARFTRN